MNCNLKLRERYFCILSVLYMLLDKGKSFRPLHALRTDGDVRVLKPMALRLRGSMHPCWAVIKMDWFSALCTCTPAELCLETSGAGVDWGLVL